MFKSCFEMILVLNDLCPQNIFIGGPWGPGGPVPSNILTAILEGWRTPPKFSQIYNHLEVYLNIIRKIGKLQKFLHKLFNIFSNFQNLYKLSIIFAKFP